jgi:hypothetical protein
MRVDLIDRRRLLGLLAALPVAAALPALAQPTEEEIQSMPSDGAIRAGSYLQMPARAHVTAQLYDDAREYVKILAAFAAALRESGWNRAEGTQLTLSIRIDTRRAIEKPLQGEPRGLFLGRMQLFLTDASGKRYWDAEAIWRPFEGEITRGAEALAPFIVPRLGQTIELESVMLY